MKIARTILFLALAALAFVGGYAYRAGKPAEKTEGGRKILYWHDPMHPAYRSDKPGIAPDCGMKLEPVYADGGPAEAASASKGRILFYRDPQNPEYTSHTPGLNPETGNELEPVYENDPSTMPPGTVRISPEKQQLIGVQYGKAEMAGGAETIRAVGKVAYDETRIAHVHTKFEGWIDQVFVDFTGELVKKGQPLLTVYSPELLATQRELLLAGRARDAMKKSSLGNAAVSSDALFEAARRRLELWDMSGAQIDRLLETRQPARSVTVHSPISGFVTERKAFPNQRIMPADDLYTVVDLSRVWIMADVFEAEAPHIRIGMPARVKLSYGGGQTIQARVNYIQPQVDPMTRTLKVRLEADNPAVVLKPDMFVDVEFRVARPAQLVVPAGAVLDAGDRRTVFLARGDGYFEPRQVETGGEIDGKTIILRGLKPGDQVVTSGNFLIDSESQLKAAAAGMGAPAGHQHGTAPAKAPEKPSPAGGHEGHGQ